MTEFGQAQAQAQAPAWGSPTATGLMIGQAIATAEWAHVKESLRPQLSPEVYEKLEQAFTQIEDHLRRQILEPLLSLTVEELKANQGERWWAFVQAFLGYRLYINFTLLLQLDPEGLLALTDEGIRGMNALVGEAGLGPQAVKGIQAALDQVREVNEVFSTFWGRLKGDPLGIAQRLAWARTKDLQELVTHMTCLELCLIAVAVAVAAEEGVEEVETETETVQALAAWSGHYAQETARVLTSFCGRCPDCGKPFIKERADQIYDQEACKKRAWDRKYRSPRRT